MVSDSRGGGAPEFSVVIPAYNVARYIGETLQGVMEQTVSDWELIVMDDGSTDDTRAVVEAVRDERIRLISQQNAGVSAARNAGMARARGRYVALLDADDVWAPSHLMRARSYFISHPNAKWYAGERTSCRDSLDKTVSGWRYEEKNYFTASDATLPHSSTVVLSRDLVPPDLFPVGVRYAEDLLAWVRIACRAPYYGTSAGATVYYRTRSEGAMQGRANPRFHDLMEAERLYPLYDQLTLPPGHEAEAWRLIHLRFVERWRCVIDETALRGYGEIVDRRRKWVGPLFSAWVKLFLFLLRGLVWVFKQPMQYYLNHHRSH